MNTPNDQLAVKTGLGKRVLTSVPGAPIACSSPLFFSQQQRARQVSTGCVSPMMRAGVGRVAPLSIRPNTTRYRVQNCGLRSHRTGVRLQAVAPSTTYHCRLTRPRAAGPSSPLVEGDNRVAPGCRTQTGQARRFIGDRFSDGSSILPASTLPFAINDKKVTEDELEGS